MSQSYTMIIARNFVCLSVSMLLFSFLKKLMQIYKNFALLVEIFSYNCTTKLTKGSILESISSFLYTILKKFFDQVYTKKYRDPWTHEVGDRHPPTRGFSRCMYVRRLRCIIYCAKKKNQRATNARGRSQSRSALAACLENVVPSVWTVRSGRSDVSSLSLTFEV